MKHFFILFSFDSTQEACHFLRKNYDKLFILENSSNLSTNTHKAMNYFITLWASKSPIPACVMLN